jgi:hypothetical protein
MTYLNKEEIMKKTLLMLILIFISTNVFADFSFIDNGDGTVTDERTGLLWLKNADCTDTVAGIDKSFGNLNWHNAETWSSGLADGACGLIDGSEAGQWRQPTKDELQGIGTDPPTRYYTQHPSNWAKLWTPFVPAEISAIYWSSTTYANVTSYSYAWFVSIRSGRVGYADKTTYYNVWPVRGGN